MDLCFSDQQLAHPPHASSPGNYQLQLITCFQFFFKKQAPPYPAFVGGTAFRIHNGSQVRSASD
jgi:hypothetical protein